MNYQQTLDWMYARLPMYQRQGAPAYKKDLTNIQLFSNYLGEPHKLFKSIHIGGTNGKGSVSHMIASILQEAGYTVGLYTSPHLKDFRERIRINGKPIDQDYVVKFIDDHQDFLEDQNLSFFELTVGMAFDAFAEAKVDVAVVEVGLGGRLDATNIITPVLSVITNIGKDHTAFLGETLPEIAQEKAGIIKPNVPVVIGEQQAKTTSVFIQKAIENRCEIDFASTKEFDFMPTDLNGKYQIKNQKTVLQAITVLQGKGAFLIPDRAIASGLRLVTQNTGLQGRWQILGDTPKIICDTGHNREGLEMVMSQLEQESFTQLHMVLGVVADKDLDSVLPLFPNQAHYYFCKPNVPRGLDAQKLQQAATKFQLTGGVFDTVNDALYAAKQVANPDDLIFIGGSTFVVAEVL